MGCPAVDRRGPTACGRAKNKVRAGQLEVQRVAPGAIALRLSSARLPSASELGELRQALEARGLSVRSLEARPLTTS